MSNLQEAQFANLAALFTIFVTVFTVIYNNDGYDFWDLLISGAVIFGIWNYRSFLGRDKATLWFSLIGLSVALTIVLFVLDNVLFDHKNKIYWTESTKNLPDSLKSKPNRSRRPIRFNLLLLTIQE